MTNKLLLSPEQVKEEINTHLTEYLFLQTKNAQTIGTNYQELLHELQLFILRGGKRLRPYLAYIAFVGSQGENVAEFMRTAIALELLHNYFLIHDDIIDRDIIRYGDLNIAGTFTKRFERLSDNSKELEHLGMVSALLAGDLQAVFSSDTIINSSFADTIKLKALSEFNRIIFIEGGGELQEVLSAHNNVTEQDIEKIYEYKSSVYTIELPLRFGSLLARGELIDYASYSRPMGLAFQLKDDLLGIFGHTELTGKPILSDLQEGKKTIMMLYALNNCTDDQKNTLKKLLGKKDTTLEDLNLVRDILVTSKAKDYIEQKIHHHTATALSAIDQLQLDQNSKKALHDISNYIIQRHK